MTLRTRLVLVLLLSALVPLAGVGVLMRPVLVSSFARVHLAATGPTAPNDDDPAVSAAREGAVASAMHDGAQVLALMAVFGAAMAVLLASWWSPALSRPIREVTQAADRIALGTRSVRIGREAAGESGTLVRAFNRMAKELDAAESRLRRAERVAAWRDIARQMAHEIKNPLTPIQMAVEMLRKARARNLPEFDALFDEETRIVLEEVARLRRLVENFSRFARAPKPRVESLSITDVVAHVVGLHVAGDGAEVTGEAEDDLPNVRADREQLTQVLVNLVANACTAAEERATAHPEQGPAAVHVTARNLRDGRVSVAVDDNGAGIDASVMDRLFEPYVSTRHERGGTGLGLAIAHRIVTDHGGTITAETSPEGTRFEVTLSLAGPPETDSTLDSEDRHLPT